LFGRAKKKAYKMAAALQNLPLDLAKRVVWEATRPHPLARLMADVRRYDGLWLFARLDGERADFCIPLTIYRFGKQTVLYPKFDALVTWKGERFVAIPLLRPNDPANILG
jgi:hypothetical protein